jgi:uncharacterized membrane protein
MIALSFWCYQTVLGAKAGATRLRRLEDRGALEVFDAVVVMWARGAHVPRVTSVRRRLVSARWTESLLGGLFEAVVDGGSEADVQASLRQLGGVLDGSGVDEALLCEVVKQLVPGSSLLVVLARVNDLDGARVVVERGVARSDVTHLLAELADDGPDRLREALIGDS